MKTRCTLLLLIICSLVQLQAQVEQVSVGKDYSQQAYYELSTGEVTTIDNDAWDIAFSALGQQDAGIFINESSPYSQAGVTLFASNTTDWTEAITDTNIFVDSLILRNEELNWREGAFNTVKDPNNPLDYGWGAYNTSTHKLEGNQIYVLKKRDGSFIKIEILSLSKGVYSFRSAALDGTNEKSYSVSKKDTDAQLIHFSFETEKVVEIPTNYDLIFQRYSTPLDPGDGNLVPYTVTGVLLAPHVEAVVLNGVDPKNVSVQSHLNDFKADPKIIGHTWKSFSFTTGWEVKDDRTQFIKTQSGDIYQLQFIDFEGKETGITTVERKQVIAASTKETSKTFRASVFPNPASDYVIIELDNNNTGIFYQLFSSTGELVQSAKTNSGDQINISSLTSGLYHLVLPQQKLTKRVFVK